MSKKVTITKLENDQVEVGIQLRDTQAPVPKNNRIEYYKPTGTLKCRVGDQDYVLSLDVVETDPISPTEKQVWINERTNQLKWHFGGTTKIVDLDNKMKVNDSQTTGELLVSLNEVELKNISGNETSPKTFIDAFIELLEDVQLTDTEIYNSSLRVKNGLTSGKYELERRTSGASNYAEGVVVVTSQGLAPREIVNNSGVFTITFKNNVLDYLSAGSKVLMYEEVIEKGIVKGYHLLRSLEPAVLTVDSATYDSVTDITTIEITDELDLTMGFSGDDIYKYVRIFPLNLEFSSGADSLTGTMTTMQIKEAYTMDKVVRVLGKTLAREVRDTFQDNGGRGMIDFAVNHSPNKQNWLIIGCVSRGHYDSAIEVWYSTDGLQTLSRFDYIGEISFPANVSTVCYNFNGESDVYVADAWTHINDDGRFLFHRVHFHGIVAYTYEYGHLAPVGEQPWIRRANAYFGGYRGIIQHEANTSYGYYPASESAVDWNNNLMAWCTSRHSTEDAYTFFSQIDWDAHIDYGKGYWSIGTDYHEVGQTGGVAFFKHFEGEDMFFQIIEHTNNLLYAFKMPVSNILAKANDCGSSSISGGGGAFSNSTSGGGRFDYATFVHSFASDDSMIIGYDWDTDDDRLVLIKHDRQDNRFGLVIIDFGRTTAGAYSEHKWEFSAVPNNGNFTFDVTDELTGTTETISPVPYSADAAQIKSIIEGLSFVTTATVTGDWTTGYNIIIESKKPITMVQNSNSLTDVNGDPVTITHTMIEEGYEPVWLRLKNMDTQTQPFTPEDGGVIDLSYNILYWDYSYYSGNNDSMGRDTLRQTKQCIKVVGKTVHILGDIRDTLNDDDRTASYYLKIPDYTECFGRVENYVTGSSLALIHEGTSDTVSKAASKWVVPSIPFGGTQYSDGLLPIRTMRFYIRQDGNDYRYSTKYDDGKDIMIWLKLVGIGPNGEPDESNVIAVSKKVPKMELPDYDNYKMAEFVFDNVALPPGQELYILAETNLPDTNDNGFYSRITLATGGGGNGVWYKKNGVWSLTQSGNKFAIQLLDFYMCPVHWLHESGWNRTCWTYSAYNTQGMWIGNSTIAKLSDTLFRCSYVHKQYPNNSDSVANVLGPSKMYSFYIDDSVGVKNLPIVKDPVIVGYKDEDYDPYLAFMYYPCIDSGREGDDRVLQKNSMTSTVYTDADYKLQRMTQVGNYWNDWNGNLGRLLTTPDGYSNHSDGQVVDDRFAMGMAVKFNDVGKIFFRGYPRYGMLPKNKDFIIEFEIALNAHDVAHSDLHLVSHYYGFYVRTLYGHYNFYGFTNSASVYTTTYETCPVDTYHRVRVVRDVDGIKIFRNFSKVGGEWEEMQLGYNNTNDGSYWKHGKMIGRSDAYNDFGIGGYYNDANHDVQGLMGYVKIAINTTEFKYEGCKNDQIALMRAKNFGDKFFATKYLGEGNYDKHAGSNVETVIIGEDNETSIVPTNDQVFKYGQAIALGQKPSIRLDIKRTTDKDPASIQGYSIKFDRK